MKIHATRYFGFRLALWRDHDRSDFSAFYNNVLHHVIPLSSPCHLPTHHRHSIKLPIRNTLEGEVALGIATGSFFRLENSE